MFLDVFLDELLPVYLVDDALSIADKKGGHVGEC